MHHHRGPKCRSVADSQHEGALAFFSNFYTANYVTSVITATTVTIAITATGVPTIAIYISNTTGHCRLL